MHLYFLAVRIPQLIVNPILTLLFKKDTNVILKETKLLWIQLKGFGQNMLLVYYMVEMAYDAPKRFFNDNYKSSIDISEKDLELYWEVQWLKNPISN